MSEIEQQQARATARFGTKETRKRHGFYMVSTWFRHGFPRPQDAQPPLPSALALPEKTLFSAT